MKFYVHEDEIEPVKITETDINIMASKHKWNGSGTKGDPYIIGSSKSLPKSLMIQKSNLYIIIKGCNLHKLILKKAENYTIEGCEFNKLIITKCSNLSIENSNINRYFFLTNSANNIIQNCTIANLNLAHSFENNFRNCTIYEGETTSSRANIIEDSELPKIFQDMLEHGGLEKKLYPFSMLVLCGVFSLVFFQYMRYVDENPTLALGAGIGMLGLIFAFIIVTIGFWDEKRKLKNYSPNQIRN